MITVAHCSCLKRCKVGTGTWLRIALAPKLFAGKNFRQEPGFLLLIAEAVDDGAHHRQTEWAQRRTVGARQFLA